MKIPRDWTTGLAILAAVIAVVVQRCEDTSKPVPPRGECPPCASRVGLLSKDAFNVNNMLPRVVKDWHVYDEALPIDEPPLPSAYIATTTSSSSTLDDTPKAIVAAACVLFGVPLLAVLFAEIMRRRG